MLLLMLPALFLCLLSAPIQAEAKSFEIDYGNHQFLKDGSPYRYIAGDIHYFRIHSSEWQDRLERVRAMGMNAVQVYVAWDVHETAPGV